MDIEPTEDVEGGCKGQPVLSEPVLSGVRGYKVSSDLESSQQSLFCLLVSLQVTVKNPEVIMHLGDTGLIFSRVVFAEGYVDLKGFLVFSLGVDVLSLGSMQNSEVVHYVCLKGLILLRLSKIRICCVITGFQVVILCFSSQSHYSMYATQFVVYIFDHDVVLLRGFTAVDLQGPFICMPCFPVPVVTPQQGAPREVEVCGRIPVLFCLRQFPDLKQPAVCLRRGWNSPGELPVILGDIFCLACA